MSSLYTFKITNLNFSLDNILGGLEAGIAEEFIFRFGIMTILIETLYNSRNKFILASLISSFLFGILHGINALAGQDLNNTIIQMIFAFSFGFYLAAIYLYTNCFYLNVIFHALIDTLVFLTSNNTVMSGKVSIGNLVGTVIEGAIFIIIGYSLIKSKSKFDSTTYEFHLFK